MRKQTLKKFIPGSLWKVIRELLILRQHKRVALICSDLISSYYASPESVEIPKAKLSFPKGTRIIWQYWAQGLDSLPESVCECMASIDKYGGDCKIIRLTDDTISCFIDIPDYILEKKGRFGTPHFSDILRSLLLNSYGGIWIDATVLLSGPIPPSFLSMPFFAFQRDPDEPRKEYWKNTYAYYFSWSKKFHVNMLSSFLVSTPDFGLFSIISGCLLKWWKENDYLPDYFFFQILFDILIKGKFKNINCPIVSDCPPHYLQQYRNDPNFFIKTADIIVKSSTIHKLTLK